jgi:hypothetical protein
MKNILVPSDFSIKSLHIVEQLLDQFHGEQLNIMLFHQFQLPDSITELIMFGREQKEYDYVSEAFWQACHRLRQQYQPHIQVVRPKCFYGNTFSVFQNFLEGYLIDLIVYPADYEFRKLSKDSIDPDPWINKCGKDVLVLAPQQRKTVETLIWEESLSLNERP